MSWEYSEDNLIETTAIELFYNHLGWDTTIAYNKETFGTDSTLGRLTKQEIILRRIFFEKMKEFNPGLPEQAYRHAYDKLVEDNITKSAGELNQEKYFLPSFASCLVIVLQSVMAFIVALKGAPHQDLEIVYITFIIGHFYINIQY